MQISLFEQETLLLGYIIIDISWSTQLVTRARVFLLNLHPLEIQKLYRVVDPNHSLLLSTSHLTTLRLHMILTKTSTKTDKFSQERLISLSPKKFF